MMQYLINLFQYKAPLIVCVCMWWSRVVLLSVGYATFKLLYISVIL